MTLRHRIISLPRERFERAVGALRHASVLATGDDARDLAELADQLEATADATAPAPPAEPVFTSFSRGEA